MAFKTDKPQSSASLLFSRVVSYIKDAYTFPSGTYRANEVKAGLYEFYNQTNQLLENSDHVINTARNNFLADADIHDGMGHDELFDIIEKLDLYMHQRFPQDNVSSAQISERAFRKADHIADMISEMAPVKIEDYAHKFDRMVSHYPKPTLVANNDHDSLG